MKVVIAGGTGLMGSELTKDLIDHGHQVLVLSRSMKRKGNLPKQTQLVIWDGQTMRGWEKLVDGADAVINLSGENIAGEKFLPTRWTRERKETILRSRIDAGKTLVDAIRCAENKPSVLIQASAIGYYGALKDEVVDETHAAGCDFLAKTCLAWEGSTVEVEDINIRRVVIRTGVVLSNKGGAFLRLILPFRYFVGGPLGSGKQYLSWIHIADQIGAIRFLMENTSAQGCYNLTAPQPVTNAAFAKVVGHAMGRFSFIAVPSFAFKLAFGEVSTVVLDGQRVIPSRLQQYGYKFRFTRVDDAVYDLLSK